MGEERIIPVPPRARQVVTPLSADRVLSWYREMEIVQEDPSIVGLVLWQDIRHVRNWAASTPEQRAVLFNPNPSGAVQVKRRDARACAPELAGVLDVFVEMRAAPLKADPSRLGTACLRAAEWAQARGFDQTAIEWAETAALVQLDDPKAANLAGRLTRNANEYDRAEIWFKRALGHAREQDNKIELIRAHLGYGRLCMELGRVKGARTHLNRGSRLAWSYGPPSLAAEAQHDLCAFLISRGHFPEAEDRARRALRWYPKNHPRLPFFAADVALLLVFERQFLAAARILNACREARAGTRSPRGGSRIVRAGARRRRFRLRSGKPAPEGRTATGKESNGGTAYALALGRRGAAGWKMGCSGVRSSSRR